MKNIDWCNHVSTAFSSRTTQDTPSSTNLNTDYTRIQTEHTQISQHKQKQINTQNKPCNGTYTLFLIFTFCCKSMVMTLHHTFLVMCWPRKSLRKLWRNRNAEVFDYKNKSICLKRFIILKQSDWEKTE